MPFTEAGKYTVLQEYYDAPATGMYSFDDLYSVAQTFIPEYTHHLSLVSFKIKQLACFWTMECALQKTGYGGVPDGTDITIARRLPIFTHPFISKWMPFMFFDFPLLEEGTRYAFVLRVPDAVTYLGPAADAVIWYAQYPRGVLYWWIPDEERWEMKVGEDLLFREWGFPIPGEVPPIQVVTNFAIEYTQYIYTETGYIIFVVTDRPCHLFMLWTNVDPQKHIDPVFERGVFIHSNPRFCFVAYEENEQEEPGDTLSHTFLKPDWRVCETRYFIFTGSRCDTIQPSMSNLFQLHRSPHVEVVFLCRESNRQLENPGVNWDICRNGLFGEIGIFWDPPECRLMAGSYLTARYWNYAGYLEFYTQQIKEGSQILGAYLDIFVWQADMTSSEAYPYLYVMEGNQHDPVERGDYGTRLAFNRYYARIRYDALIPGQYNRLYFNSYGVSKIKAGEITKLCLRSQLDVEDEPPPLGANLVYFHSMQKGDEFQPLLGVFWKPPPIPNWIEYWGRELESNHPWERIWFFIPGDYVKMYRGTMTLFSDYDPAISIGVNTEPQNPQLVLDGAPLRVFHSTPFVELDADHGFLSFHIGTRKGDEFMWIEAIIARGNIWGPWGSAEAYWDENYAFDLGQGPGSFDFVAKWRRGREMGGFDTDPTGWYVYRVVFRNEQVPATQQQWLTSDYLGFTYEK